MLGKSYASIAFICVYQLSGRSNECKKDVDDENDGEVFVEEQEMCDGRIFFVTFFLLNRKERVSNKHHKDKPLSSW